MSLGNILSTFCYLKLRDQYLPWPPIYFYYSLCLYSNDGINYWINHPHLSVLLFYATEIKKKNNISCLSFVSLNYTRTEKFFEKLPVIKKPVVDYWSDVNRHESRKWKSESWRGFGKGKCSSVSHLFFSLHLSFLFSPFSKCLKKAGYQTIGKISTLAQPSKRKHVTKKA